MKIAEYVKNEIIYIVYWLLSSTDNVLNNKVQ